MRAGKEDARIFGIGLCLWAMSGCIVSPPTAAELVAVGFRSPEQTFRTFQTASAGDLADLEFSCLSVGFRSRNGISKLNYLEVRDELREPGFRYAIDRAEIESVERLAPHRCRILARTVGRTLAVEMVREDFYELWTVDGLLDSGDVSFETSARVVSGPAIEVRAPLPEGFDAGELIEVSLRREWKIDGYEVRDDDASGPTTAESP